MKISHNKATGLYVIEVNQEEFANLNNGLGCAMRLSEESNMWNDRLAESDRKCCDAMDKDMLEAYV